MIKVTAKQMLLVLALIVPGHALAEDKAIPDTQSADAAIQQSGDNNSSTIEDKLKAQKTQSTTTTIQTAPVNLLAYIKLNLDRAIAIIGILIALFGFLYHKHSDRKKEKAAIERHEELLNAQKTDKNREEAQRTVDSAKGQNLGHIASEIVEATKLQISNQYDKSIDKWLAIATATEKNDKVAASMAYFSAAYLIQEYKEKDEATVNRAIDLYSKSIELHPTASAYNNRGALNGKLGEHGDAIDDFNEAIKLNSDDHEAYYNRGIVKDDMNNPGEAIKDYDEAIRLKPNYIKALLNRGLAWSKIDKPEYGKAIADFNDAIKLDSKNPDAYYNRGVAKSIMGENEEAITDFSNAIRLKPNYQDAYYNRGVAKSIIGENEEAITDFSDAIKLKPNYPKAYSNRGSAKGNMGNFNSAINDFNDAIKLDPDLVSAHIGRGVADTSLGKYDEALADFRKVLELEPGNEEVKQAIAEIEAIGKND